MGDEIATFAAGCFWGVQSIFQQIKGVKNTRVGYTGGYYENPTYKDVCSDKTGHAEAIEIVFNPEEVSYEELIEIFWNIHDPTTPNRQGWDVGSQYRSGIFYHDEIQKEKAVKSKQNIEDSKRYKRSIVTQIVPFLNFWEAEEYHQRYNEKRGKTTSCRSYIKLK